MAGCHGALTLGAPGSGPTTEVGAALKPRAFPTTSCACTSSSGWPAHAKMETACPGFAAGPAAQGLLAAAARTG